MSLSFKARPTSPPLWQFSRSWEVGLLSLVGADQFALGDRVLFRRPLDVGDFGAGRHLQSRHVEREEPEMIVVRAVALGRAGAAIARFAEIIGDFGTDLAFRAERAGR